MSNIHEIAAVAIMALVTFFLRGVPFVAFRKKKVPKYIEYLGNALPFAAMAMLVVYCLKGVKIMTGNHGIPELVSVIIVVLLHIWKKNTVLSVVVGTACYMILIRIIGPFAV
ncbi:MAG: branched-chain amino acid transporter permease [Lachnospiraceae bacterium]|nr:branched-chain amino acid transporter permease [Lachnospiraceae bacterium]